MAQRPAPDSQYDIQLVSSKLTAIVGNDCDPSDIKAFVHEGAPVSKSRARYNRQTHKFYTPSKTSAEEEALAWRFTELTRGEMIKGCVAIVAIFFRPNYQRIDADNLMKLVMDAATQAKIWKDDCYVTAQASFIELDRERPRTLVAFCPSRSSLDRFYKFTCEICNKPFTKPGRATFKNPKKFCSQECWAIRNARIRAARRCPRCDKQFQFRTWGQRYCSKECVDAARNDPLVRQKRALQRPWPKCAACGERVSRREYVHCWKCRFHGRKAGSKNETWKGVPVKQQQELLPELFFEAPF